MDSSKAWYESTAIWGGVMAMAAPVLGALFHFQMEPGDVRLAAEALAQVGAGAGGLMAIWGRLKATKAIR